MQLTIKKTVAGMVYLLLLQRSMAQPTETKKEVLPQPDEKTGTWSVSAHVLTGEMPGTQTLAGAAWRKGRHKFEASLMAGPFGKSYSPRIQPPVLSYRYFVFKQGQKFHPYAMVLAAGTYSKRTTTFTAVKPGVFDDPNAEWQTKGIQTEKFTNVCITFGAGTEFLLGNKFYADAHVSLGPCYYRQQSTQVYESSTFRPPVPYRNIEGTKLGTQLSAGIGYQF